MVLQYSWWGQISEEGRKPHSLKTKQKQKTLESTNEFILHQGHKTMKIESIHSHTWAFVSCAKVKGCEGLELAKSLVHKLVYATGINPASGSWLTVSYSRK